MKKPGLLLLAACLSLGACALNPNGSIDWKGSLSGVSANINHANLVMAKYAPLVGKDLLAIGSIIVQAECSPILNPATNATEQALKILAPNNAAAASAASALETNAAVAATLCPLYQSIVTAVGNVPTSAPSGAPIQTIPVS